MKNHIKILEDVFLYKGEFYTKEDIPHAYTHNRDSKCIYNFKNINEIPDEIIKDYISYDKPVIFLHSFQNHMAHLMWDFMYTSYYCLFYYNENYWNEDFQWICQPCCALDESKLDILETFSGCKVTTPDALYDEHDKPIKIKLLLCGIRNLGIGNVHKNLCMSKQFKNHDLNPVECFVNRFYSRYKIIRNNYAMQPLNEKINKIIYIKNKRPCGGINNLFNILSDKYKYDFEIIDWAEYELKEQLEICNTTRLIICGVGSARANTPFLPKGSIEIQTNNHKVEYPNHIDYYDCHIGTISDYIKVININEYTKREAEGQLVSENMEKITEEALTAIPTKIPIDVEENIPEYLRNDVLPNITEKQFMNWRALGEPDSPPVACNDSAWLYRYYPGIDPCYLPEH